MLRPAVALDESPQEEEPMKPHSVLRIGLVSLMLVGAFIAGQRDRTHPGALSRAAARLVCQWGRYYCGSSSCSSNVKGGWLLVSATRPKLRV
jgi:hypothetical protein